MSTVHRKRANERVYAKYLKAPQQTKCEFCRLNIKDKHVLKVFKHHKIVRNIYGYDMWDMHNVVDHLLIVPLRHVVSINDLSKPERVDLIDLLADYDKRGYNIYARTGKSVQKTVPHQHTHLIKLGKNKKKFILYSHKPLVNIFK